MKLVNIVLVACMLCAASAVAQKKEIPVAAKAAFAKAYATATKVKWEQEGDKYEASFMSGGKEMSVLYSASGAAVETETKIAIAELPAKAQKYAQAKGNIKEAARIVAANGTVKYEAEVKGKDLLFDNEGNFMEAKSDKR